MEAKSSMNLFISYSHADEGYIKEFIKHISPLKDNGLIKEWYDRKILGGNEFQDDIDKNLDDADIICLFVSANFLDSEACKKEKKYAMELKRRKGIVVVSVILSPCAWFDDKDISPVLVFPTDGNPVSKFSDFDTAWQDVYNGVKKVIEGEKKIKNMIIDKQFMSFLTSTELLAKAHSQKKEVFLDDIFVYPELKKYDDLREYETKINSREIIGDFTEYSKILIAGEDQSGKTTLCKKMYIELRAMNFIPVYVYDHNNQYEGHITQRIEKAYKEQYGKFVLFEEIDKKRIVPIIDDFHYAKKKEKHVQDLKIYCHQIVIVDDVFSLNFKDENLIRFFNLFGFNSPRLASL